MRLCWSERFRTELRNEYEYLRRENPDVARGVIHRILEASRRLSEFPRSGRTWRLEGAWELVIPGAPYVVIYDIGDDSVVLLTLFHTSRRIPHIH